MKDNILKTISHEYPEIKAKLHLPQLCMVIQPIENITGASTRETPKHAVTVQLLNEDLTINANMPPLEEVPVVMPFAGMNRGLCALPQPGAICEICFAFGKLTLPFIRSILPLNLILPTIKKNSIKIQWAAGSFIEVEDQSITQKTPNIYLTAENEIKAKAKEILEYAQKIHIGTNNDNFLKIVSDFMHATATAFASLAAHTHPYINVAAPATTSPNQQGSNVTTEQNKIISLKGKLDDFTK